MARSSRAQEQLAGFCLIEARDLNEAIELAARIPSAFVGCIGIRPIRPIREQLRSGRTGQGRRDGVGAGSAFQSVC